MSAMTWMRRYYRAITAFNQRLNWRMVEWSGAFRYRDAGYCMARLEALSEKRNHYTPTRYSGRRRRVTT